MTSNTTVAQSERDLKGKKEKEIVVVNDCGTFVHETGDIYEGWFEAKKKDKSIKMHGEGTYVTSEGDIYSGSWEADKLVSTVEDVEIKYTSGANYKGKFKDWCYSGPGTYIYTDETVLTCDFQENSPIGNLHLVDPNQHVWFGKACPGYGWFSPTNHYYDMLEVTIAKVKKPKKILSISELSVPIIFPEVSSKKDEASKKSPKK